MVEPIRLQKRSVYFFPGEPSLKFDSTCGELLDKLTAICLGEPEFLRQDACRRYLHLLPDFKKLAFPVCYGPSQKDLDILVVKERLRAIRRAMDEWFFPTSGRSTTRVSLHTLSTLRNSSFTERHMIYGHRHYAFERGDSFEVNPWSNLPKTIRWVPWTPAKGLRLNLRRATGYAVPLVESRQMLR
jgi:hypothetical protein